MTAVEASSFPLLSKEGRPRSGRGWLVKSRVASVYARVAILILFEITNHPVCATKERDLFINGAATPPFSRRGMDPSRNQPIPSTLFGGRATIRQVDIDTPVAGLHW